MIEPPVQSSQEIDRFRVGALRVNAVVPQQLHPSESAAAPADASAATSLTTLLTRHILRDGEGVLLIIKPSLWFILFSSMRFATAAAILAIAARVYDDEVHWPLLRIIELFTFLVAGRVMFSVLQWMGRLYILTDLRVLRLSGVFTTHIYDCPVRKIARTRLIYTAHEQIVGLGSIEIIPFDDSYPIQLWQTVARPRQVHEQIVASINRGRQCAL